MRLDPPETKEERLSRLHFLRHLRDLGASAIMGEPVTLKRGAKLTAKEKRTLETIGFSLMFIIPLSRFMHRPAKQDEKLELF